MRALWLSVLVLSACGGGPSPTDGVLTPASYCGVARTPDIVSWSRGIVTTCPPATDPGEEARADCSHFRIDGSALSSLGLTDVQVALGAANGAVVLWKVDGSLVLREAGGAERTLAAWAADPSVGSSGTTVAYLTAAVPNPEPGEPMQVVLHTLSSPTGETLVTDLDASTPHPLPDGSGVLFVSTRTGLASFWRAQRGASETQLTNVGLVTLEQGFVPTPGAFLVWASQNIAVFGTTYDGPRLWQLDVTTGDALELGPGSLPQLGTDGSVLALGGSEAGCASRYPLGGGAP